MIVDPKPVTNPIDAERPDRQHEKRQTRQREQEHVAFLQPIGAHSPDRQDENRHSKTNQDDSCES